MVTYSVNYWTGDTKSVRARSLAGAARQAGYTDAYLRKHGDAETTPGTMYVFSEYGDLCATIAAPECVCASMPDDLGHTCTALAGQPIA